MLVALAHLGQLEPAFPYLVSGLADDQRSFAPALAGRDEGDLAVAIL